MKASLRWLNEYLTPGGVTAQQADDLLTDAGFPIEEHVPVEGSAHGDGDVMLDVEITSNRGDCLSHVGLAREIAACAGGEQALTLPKLGDDALAGLSFGPAVSESLSLENREPGVCPRFTARVIRGCRVGPSPDWLVRALEAVGQRSINNAVDVTNWITFELGNPCHVFDLSKLAGGSLVVRFASEGETLTTLDEKARVLKSTDLVVADAERAQSLAGVIGGADSEVSDTTTDIVLEMATWDPVTIRTAARRLAIRTDAGHRFERIVDPRSIDDAAARAAALIAELTGGTVAGGVLDEGAPAPEPVVVELRPERCDRILGIPTERDAMVRLLESLEIGVENAPGPGPLRCTIPVHRQDLPREIDLIEEVARVRGYQDVPILDTLELRTRHPQESERAVRELGSVLTGLGFFEAVTFSFVDRSACDLFMPEGLRPASVDDERRGAEPYLRPSAVPSLLQCRRVNQDARVHQPGGVRLFELSAVFAEDERAGSVERRVLAMLGDVPGEGPRATFDHTQEGLRRMRGAVDAVARAMAGPAASVRVVPAPPPHGGYDPDAFAEVRLVTDDGDAGSAGQRLGCFGLVSAGAMKNAGVDRPVVAAELNLDDLVACFPPRTPLSPIPAFPSIERDVSLLVAESVRWADIDALVAEAGREASGDLGLLAGWSYVGVFRGKPIGAGRKSVSFRLEFRDPARTLRHEEVEPGVERIITLAKERLGAELRA